MAGIRLTHDAEGGLNRSGERAPVGALGERCGREQELNDDGLLSVRESKTTKEGPQEVPGTEIGPLLFGLTNAVSVIALSRSPCSLRDVDVTAPAPHP